MRRILVTLATVAAVTMLAVTTMVFVNIHPANAATKSALAAQSTLPNDGPLTPGEYLTRSVLPNGTVTYTPNVWLKPDGKVHRWRYNIQCADGLSGCFVLITASNTPGTPGKVSSGLSPNSCGLSCQTNYETLTNDYVTCTGFFGSCGAYTEAKKLILHVVEFH